MRFCVRGSIVRRRCEQPQKKIHVVRTFGQQRSIPVFRLPSPVSAHVAMGEVPPSDRLDVLDGEDVADHFFFEEKLSQEEVVRTISQDVADGEDFRLLLGSWWSECSVDGEAIFETCCER